MEESRKKIRIPALLLLILLIFRLFIPQYINDDGYITLSVVKNIFAGEGLSFNPGEKHFVLTNPAWAYLITIITVFSRNAVDALRILGFCSEFFLLIVSFRFALLLFNKEKLALLFSLAIFMNPVFLFSSLGGMETPLYLSLVIFSFLLYRQGKFPAALAIAALSVWVRFDGVILFLILGGFIILQKRMAITHLIMPMVIFLAYIIHGLLIFDAVIPAGVLVKSKPDLWFSGIWWNSVPTLVWEILKSVAGFFRNDFILPHPLILIAPFVIYALAGKKKGMEITVYSATHALFLVSGGTLFALNFPWYFAPILPGAYILAINGLNRMPSKVLTFLVIFLPLVGFVISFAEGGIKYKFSHFPRERTYASFAKMLPSRELTVSANETGTIRYYAPSAITIYDPTGLSSKPVNSSPDRIKNTLIVDPDIIVEKENFSFLDTLEKIPGNTYLFSKYGSLDLAVKPDLFPILNGKMPDLRESYDTGKFYLPGNRFFENFFLSL